MNKGFNMNKVVVGILLLVLAGCDQGTSRTAINMLDNKPRISVSDPAEL
jgi:hypothetical protein